MKTIDNVIREISLSDVEFLVYLRDKIIKKGGYEYAMPLERIINAIDELKELIEK